MQAFLSTPLAAGTLSDLGALGDGVLRPHWQDRRRVERGGYESSFSGIHGDEHNFGREGCGHPVVISARAGLDRRVTGRG